MVLDAPIQDDKKSGTKPGENVASEAIGKRSPVSRSASGNATGNPVVDSLPEVPILPELDQQNPPGKPQLKTVIERDDEDDDAPVKGGKGLKKGDMARIVSTLAAPDGGMIVQDRLKLLQAFKNIIKEADEQQKIVPNFDRKKFIAAQEKELLDQINGRIADLPKGDVPVLQPPGWPQKETRPAKTVFSIVNSYDETDGTVAKSYRLSQTTIEKDGKESTINKRLLQTVFDQKGEVIEPANSIFSKLKDGIVTPQERELVEGALQAVYRD